MTQQSAYQQLEDVLRQMVQLRASGASPAALAALENEAWELWEQVPPTPAGAELVWPQDIAAIADELGFGYEDISAEAEPLSDDLAAGIAEASRLQKLASQIDAAIVEVGGVGNVRVACSASRIVITGIAADDDARDQALLVAAKLAPGIEIEDAIDVA